MVSFGAPSASGEGAVVENGAGGWSSMPFTGDNENEKFERAWIAGSVIAAGRPLAGVSLMARRAGDGSGYAVAENAANGNFALGVGEGRWIITGSKKGHYCKAAVEVTVAAGQASESVTIEMVPSRAFIEGVVVDESGKPIANAQVSAMPNMMAMGEDAAIAMMTGAENFFQAPSGRAGTFKLETMRGRYLVSAHAEGYELSPMNPGPSIPGMEDIPAEFRSMMPAMAPLGIDVTVEEGETVRDVKIILRRVPESEVTVRDTGSASVTREELRKNQLFGRASRTPNNVLHWHREDRSEAGHAYVVVRSTRPFGSEPPGSMAWFKFPEQRFGQPGPIDFSFTDHTAIPGTKYWYAVYEQESDGHRGPYSNPVEITTRGTGTY